VLEVIESGRADAMRVRDLADLAAISEPHFKAKFRRQVGMPPGEYLNRNRIERAAALLAESDLSVTQVAHRLGFNSSQYFATTFKRFTHASPGEVIRRRTSSASR
jgi:AraC-like DNA-binding protein